MAPAGAVGFAGVVGGTAVGMVPVGGAAVMLGRGVGKFGSVGPVPGTASVIGDTVFTSSFETRKSVGYDVHTHERDFALPSAGYSPVVSDGARLYVAGYYTLYALEPIGKRKYQP